MMYSESEPPNDAYRNDRLRKCLPGVPPEPHRLILSSKMATLSPRQQWLILLKVKNYSTFCHDSDPDNTRDYGSFVFDDMVIIWKIDSLSDNTALCLTIMSDDEY